MNTATLQESEPPTVAEEQQDQPVVFFDGVCGLCHATVDFFLKRDRDGVFLFAPLQGNTAKERLDSRDTTNLGGVVLQVNGKTYRHSSAAVRMLWRLGDVWSVVGAMLWLVPWPIRHIGYKVVAANRYRLLGKRETCRLPTPEECGRFLP